MSCGIVTGGSRGIGREIALALAEQGYNIVFTYVNPNNDVSEVIKEIEAFGVSCLGIISDVTDFEKSKEVMDKAVEAFGGIDVLVNNAGITRDGLLMRMKEEDFDQVIKTNVNGTFNCTKHASRYMMKQKSGVIINMSSVVGITGNLGQTNYSASKGAINAFTKSCAQELARYNIRVNAIAPGFIQTDMTQSLPQEVKDNLLKSIPLQTLGKPKDIANCVEFLASEKASYITGQIISVNGGMV